MSRQREIPELIAIMEAGASREQVVLYTLKILDWAAETVKCTHVQTYSQQDASADAAERIRLGQRELLRDIGAEVPQKPQRSEERREGTEGVSKCKARRGPDKSRKHKRIETKKK